MTATRQPAVRYGSEQLDELLARIAEGAAERERTGTAPFEQIGWLKEAGFGALRIPVEEGGGGASVREFFDVLMRLSHADSNVGHLLRAHFGTVEDQLISGDAERRALWVERVVGGALIGNGNNELTTRHAGDFAKATTLTPAGDGGFLLNGTKYYSTGTLYSDYTFVTAVTPDGMPAFVLVPTDRDGVTVEDDWDGFGQRLTATGTTRLVDVAVAPDEAFLPPADLSGLPRWHLGPFYQHYLNAVIAGNIRSVLDDAVTLVQGRRRSFTHGSADLPREDPVLLEVIGEISADAAAAEAIVLQTADALGAIGDSVVGGLPDDDVIHAAALRASEAQVAIDELGLRSANLLFEVGGASAVKQGVNLDRHWRNIRTVASHNPARFKNRAIAAWLVNGERLPDNTYF
ncbi:acyl-CoA dehydrogenase family protein [Conexibacter stalactiti]|uniref:Dibenzothiophene monooxygenase n=1 Tax=Conexibacter stalactiti TaxID=1940611 RepID=A0ABU4HKP8_9ACTN|nr:acyl-CoA dehydrogenase family protein [Conexibacter stalactiti]MDW5593847.1 acyl-CoA dehydrogenase family protein [Conexibacter stalactiti]MEC5034489.1 acyl-CoA dehydrogenase family protein [Conexibacter stalactiti]